MDWINILFLHLAFKSWGVHSCSTTFSSFQATNNVRNLSTSNMEPVLAQRFIPVCPKFSSHYCLCACVVNTILGK
ncbi:hypothetical protein GHT06_012163 [Daphnia sinensis]|uniref:Secreted protein n=1 Tax=Daphnia sinensis TaxID=1820382 RepID=A0AAD5KVD8_9CRUS|nr:hypothetical protein GHT06_012163 [Daphnia sinensis]